MRPPNDYVNVAARGAIGAVGISLGAFCVVLIWKALVAFLRAIGVVAGKAINVVDQTSSRDIARAMGSATAKVERKASPLIEAFRQGRRDSEGK